MTRYEAEIPSLGITDLGDAVVATKGSGMQHQDKNGGLSRFRSLPPAPRGPRGPARLDDAHQTEL